MKNSHQIRRGCWKAASLHVGVWHLKPKYSLCLYKNSTLSVNQQSYATINKVQVSKKTIIVAQVKELKNIYYSTFNNI